VKATAESVTEGVDLSGKIALVTGATSGLGRECARVLALRGARVVIACRNLEKGHATAAEIGVSTGADAAGRVEPRPCELTDMDAVRALAARLERVDLLFLNAGVFGLPFALTDAGLERSYAANYLGHFLLVHQLAAAGRLAPDARIVSTLSEGAYLHPLSKSRPEMLTEPSRGSYSRSRSSPDSKVMLALLAVAFSERAKQTPLSQVTFNSALPPGTLTDNVNQVGAVAGALSKLLAPVFFKPVEEGSTVLAWTATSPEAGAKTACAFSHHLREKRLPNKCVDPALAEQLWDASEAALDLPAWPAADG